MSQRRLMARPFFMPSSRTGRTGVTVATWNLWWRFGDWPSRLAAITTTLQHLDPDIIGLQEVWSHHGHHAADELAGRLDMYCEWVPSPVPAPWRDRLGLGPGDWGVGNAILSRWPIRDGASERLPKGERQEDRERTVVAGSIAAPGGELPFFTTQLSAHPADSKLRMKQVTSLARFVNAFASRHTYPPVVTGDFNAMAESDEMRTLEGHLTSPIDGDLLLCNAWRDAPADDPGYTWDRANPHVSASGEPSARIDHILVGTGASTAGRVLDVGRFGEAPVDAVWPSDHAGLYAVLNRSEITPQLSTTQHEWTGRHD